MGVIEAAWGVLLYRFGKWFGPPYFTRIRETIATLRNWR
jgi:hypothetical protein